MIKLQQVQSIGLMNSDIGSFEIQSQYYRVCINAAPSAYPAKV